MKLEVEYLSQEQLEGFEGYKYSCMDTNPISIYVMHPFWNRVIKLCPKWIAPNVLTFVGFLFTVLNLLLFSYYDYYLYASSSDHPEYAPIPKWVFAMAGFNLFMAHTLDGIDGKQARRTSTSGPLGELFDHGLDSWTAMSITTCMFSVFGRTDHSVSCLRMYWIMWNVLVNFYLSHWEKYNTGVLFLPWGYDASMLATMLIYIITSIAGQNFWKFTLAGGYTSGKIVETIIYLSTIVADVPVVLWNIYKSYRDKTGKMRSFPEAMRPMVPLVVLLVSSSLWLMYLPNKIIDKDPRIIYFMIGTIFSHICVRLIVSQMSNTRCEAMPWMVVLLQAVIVFTFFVPNSAMALLYTLTLVTLAWHIHYGTCVVRQMCRHFRLRPFHIKERSE